MKQNLVKLKENLNRYCCGYRSTNLMFNISLSGLLTLRNLVDIQFMGFFIPYNQPNVLLLVLDDINELQSFTDEKDILRYENSYYVFI